MLPDSFLQKGHWKSSNSTMVMAASAGPRVGTDASIANSERSAGKTSFRVVGAVLWAVFGGAGFVVPVFPACRGSDFAGLPSGCSLGWVAALGSGGRVAVCTASVPTTRSGISAISGPGRIIAFRAVSGVFRPAPNPAGCIAAPTSSEASVAPSMVRQSQQSLPWP